MCTIVIKAVTSLNRTSCIKLYKNYAQSRLFSGIALKSIPDCILIGPPGKPQKFTVDVNPSNPRQLFLTWEKPAVFTDAIQRYELQERVRGGSWQKVMIGGTVTKFNVTASTPTTSYDFRIRAHDQLTWSEYTDTFTIVSMDGKFAHVI